MPRKKDHKGQHNHQGSHRAPVVKPAPMLFKQNITLTDVYEVSANAVLANGNATFSVSPDGFRLNASLPWRGPQTGLWN